MNRVERPLEDYLWQWCSILHFKEERAHPVELTVGEVCLVKLELRVLQQKWLEGGKVFVFDK